MARRPQEEPPQPPEPEPPPQPEPSPEPGPPYPEPGPPITSQFIGVEPEEPQDKAEPS